MSATENGSAGPPAEGSGGMEEASHLLETLETLPLQAYFSLHPHPIYVLPSPRLSSSSAPSLRPIWSNTAAVNILGDSLSSCMDEAEQAMLKAAISQLDLAQEDSSVSEAARPGEEPPPSAKLPAMPSGVAGRASSVGTGTNTTGTDGSVSSYFDEASQSHELSLFRPDWSVHKTFYALITRSPHPSFCILHLHPPPKKLAARRGDAVPYRGQFLPPPTLHSSARSSIAPSSRAGGSRRGTRSGSDMGSGTGSGSFSFTNSTFSGSIGIPPRSRLNQEYAIAEETEMDESGSSSRRRAANGQRTAVPGASVGSGSVSDGAEGAAGRHVDRDDSSDDEIVSCASLITQTDWSETPLGPRSKWPGSLRTALSILLKTPNECVIWWGPEFLMLYNDLHAQSIGDQHPTSFGKPAAEAWGVAWSEYKAMAESVMNDGAALAREDDLIFLNEIETYQSWRWTPLTRGDGTTGGVMINSLDVTRKILKQRWLMIVRDLSTRLSSSRTITEFSENVLKTVEQSPEDFSFAYLYAAKNITAATREKEDIQLQLAGTVGVPYLHSSAPQTISLNFQEFDKSNPQAMPDETGLAGSPWPFREAFMTRRMVMIWDLAPELADALEHRSWGDPPTSAVCIPITDDWENGRLSFLIVGLNTRRPYDADYEEFITDVQSLLLSNLKGIALFESEARRLRQLEELDRAKTVFFTTISHELKTPLTLIKGPIHDLSKGEQAPKRKKIFTLALRNINRLARLVDGLMDFARLEAGRLRGTFRPTDLGFFTIDLASSFRSAMELSHLDYVVDCELAPSKEMLVFADRDFWEKVVFNLIGNAYKYTLSGSITVSAKYRPEGFVFSVKDTGVGIAKPEQELVFERFHRVEGTARSHEGTGIGLSLTLELVSLSGGQLALESRTAADSEDGQTSGSTFTVTIPYGKAHLPPNQVEDAEDDRQTGKTAYGEGILAEASRWGKGGQSDSASGSASASFSDSGMSNSDSVGVIDLSALYWAKDKDCILVVDDSSDMVAYLRSLLGVYCRILTATNGQEGLDIAIKHRPDLIISDISMPVMDGVTFLSHLRRREDTELIPFILLTARSSDEDKVDGLLLGADDYLTKPFSGKELVARAHLQTQLGKKRSQLAQKFREQLKTNQLLIDLSPIGICRMSVNGDVEQLNDAYYRMTGQPKDAPKHTWLEYLDDASREWAIDAFKQLGVDAHGFTCELLWRSGTWTYTQVVPLAGDTDRSHGVICTHTDITDRKRLQQMEVSHERSRFEEAEAQRQKADEEKRQQEFLISVISHELRNPVSAILQCCNLVHGNLAFLHDELKACLEPEPPFVPSLQLLDLIREDLDALDSIHEMAMSQERIANDVLSMGKFTLNTLEICPIPVDLVAEAQKTIATFATECRTKHIKLELVIGEQLKTLCARGNKIFMADPVRIGQICLNLVSNAIRFTATAPTRKITFQLDVRRNPPVDDSCRIPPQDLTDEPVAPESPYYLYGAVEDTGPGLKPEELELLFRRFSQANKATHTVRSLGWQMVDVFGGSGLGLYVSRILTQIMHGRIEVESVVDEGSTFRYFLKIATGAPDSKVGQQKAKPLPVFERPLHILIVEDNEINSRVLSRQLVKASLTFEIAINGQEGLDKIIRSMQDGVQAFDAVLMDINMPVLNGIEATRRLRMMEASGEVPRRTVIIGLTGNAQEEQVAETKEAGMDHTIIKPYKIDDVLWTLKGL